jgi:hypothetical protein
MADRGETPGDVVNLREDVDLIPSRICGDFPVNDGDCQDAFRTRSSAERMIPAISSR